MHPPSNCALQRPGRCIPQRKPGRRLPPRLGHGIYQGDQDQPRVHDAHDRDGQVGARASQAPDKSGHADAGAAHNIGDAAPACQAAAGALGRRPMCIYRDLAVALPLALSIGLSVHARTHTRARTMMLELAAVCLIYPFRYPFSRFTHRLIHVLTSPHVSTNPIFPGVRCHGHSPSPSPVQSQSQPKRLFFVLFCRVI